MNENHNTQIEKKPLHGGYNPGQRGYKPTQGSLNPNDPPRGGSGVNSNNSNSSSKNGSKKDSK